MLSVIEELSRGTHRIGVVDEEEKLVNIITQGSVLRFIKQHVDLLGKKKEMKLSSMWFKSSQYVMSISTHQKAIDAFRLIAMTKVGAVAVVNDEGVLIGNCSAMDLKKSASTLSNKFFARLFKPVMEFLGEQELVVATPEETLETIIDRIVQKRIHRIYVVNKEGKAQGLFSLTDILEEILKRE